MIGDEFSYGAGLLSRFSTLPYREAIPTAERWPTRRLMQPSFNKLGPSDDEVNFSMSLSA